MFVRLVAFTAALATIAEAGTVTVGGIDYTWAPGVNTNAGQVSNLYNAGVRPITKQQFDAIILASAGALDSLLNNPSTDQPTYWNQGNATFEHVSFTGSMGSWTPSPAINVSASAVSTGFITYNPVIACVNGLPINIIDNYGPSYTITDNLSDSCLCYSQYSGSNCSVFTTASNCTNSTTSQNTTQTGQQVIKDGVDGGSINPITEAVDFEIDSPQMATRRYTAFQWGICGNNADINNAALTTFKMNTDQSSCTDAFTFGYRVADLESVCGLEKAYYTYNNGNPQPSNDSVRYRGDHFIYYNETVTLVLNGGADTQDFNRTGRLVTPIDVYLKRNFYTAELTNSLNATANTTIYVYSPFQFKAAITSTTVKANSTTALVSVTFGISNPYEISCLGTSRPGDGEGDAALPGLVVQPNTARAYAIGANANPLIQENVCQSDSAGLSPCSSYDANGFCWKSVSFLIILDSSVCSLDHSFTIREISVVCNAALSPQECPLSPSPDTSTGLSFTVRAADFCDGQRSLVINNAVTIKAYVPQRVQSRTDITPLRSYIIGQAAYLTLFIDTDRSLKVYRLQVLNDVDGGFQTKVSGSSSYTTPDAATQYIANVNSNAGVNGFDIATQTHSMSILLDCAFVQDGVLNGLNRNCLVAPALGGAAAEIYAKLTFYVDYETGRRRRRQTTSERGFAALETQVSVDSGIVQAQAATPSSASTLACSHFLASIVAIVCALYIV